MTALVPVQNLRSGVSSKRPVASGLAFGQVAVNYNEDDPAIYLRGHNNALIKVAPTFVGSGAPNAVPASGGASGNSIGESWLDTSSSPPSLKIWDGASWSASYTLASGSTILSPLLVNATLSGTTVIESGSTVQDALLVDVTLSGTTAAPTPASGDSSTAIATTQFVSNAINAIPEGVSLGLVVALA